MVLPQTLLYRWIALAEDVAQTFLWTQKGFVLHNHHEKGG